VSVDLHLYLPQKCSLSPIPHRCSNWHELMWQTLNDVTYGQWLPTVQAGGGCSDCTQLMMLLPNGWRHTARKCTWQQLHCLSHHAQNSDDNPTSRRAEEHRQTDIETNKEHRSTDIESYSGTDTGELDKPRLSVFQRLSCQWNCLHRRISCPQLKRVGNSNTTHTCTHKH